MIHNISVFFFASILFVSLCIKADENGNKVVFNELVLKKVAVLLELKQKSRELREKLHPGGYEKREIINEQYLDGKREKLLAQYEEFVKNSEGSLKWDVSGLAVSSIATIGFLIYNQSKFIFNYFCHSNCILGI
jgi:hypothetical protein